MSMAERVAEAIFLKEGRAKDVAWKDADKVLALLPAGQKVSDYYRDIARACLSEIEAAGYAVVPVEPSEEMLKTCWSHSVHSEGDGGGWINEEDAAENWSAMLAASRKV